MTGAKLPARTGALMQDKFQPAGDVIGGAFDERELAAGAKRGRGRPKQANRKILAQQKGVAGEAIEGFARLLEAAGMQTVPSDLRLETRYRAFLSRGYDTPTALQLAGAAPDIYSCVLRRTGQSSAAGAAQDQWCRLFLDHGSENGAWSRFRYCKLSDLSPEELPARMSARAVKAAVLRMKPTTDRGAARHFRALLRAGNSVELAFVQTCRDFGYGAGLKGDGTRGRGFSELKKALLINGCSEVEGLRLHSPRAKRNPAQ